MYKIPPNLVLFLQKMKYILCISINPYYIDINSSTKYFDRVIWVYAIAVTDVGLYILADIHLVAYLGVFGAMGHCQWEKWHFQETDNKI